MTNEMVTVSTNSYVSPLPTFSIYRPATHLPSRSCFAASQPLYYGYITAAASGRHKQSIASTCVTNQGYRVIRITYIQWRATNKHAPTQAPIPAILISIPNPPRPESRPHKYPDQQASLKLAQNYLSFRTAGSLIPNLTRAIQSTNSWIEWNSQRGTYEEQLGYAHTLAIEERELGRCRDMVREGQVGTV